jgi:anti-sigma B factor antagonist
MAKNAQHKILALEGEIDLHLSPGVAQELQVLVRQQPPKLIVDLTKVSYIDSSGLAVLLEGMQSVASYRGKFCLIGVGAPLRTVFESSRLDQVFRIYPDVDAALAAN